MGGRSSSLNLQFHLEAISLWLFLRLFFLTLPLHLTRSFLKKLGMRQRYVWIAWKLIENVNFFWENSTFISKVFPRRSKVYFSFVLNFPFECIGCYWLFVITLLNLIYRSWVLVRNGQSGCVTTSRRSCSRWFQGQECCTPNRRRAGCDHKHGCQSVQGSATWSAGRRNQSGLG